MTDNPVPTFDPREAIRLLSSTDRHLARLIRRAVEFRIEPHESETPYESLLRAIVYQSISGKAASTIFARIRALGPNGNCPTPEEMLRLPPQVLRKAGLSRAKIDAAKDLARKTLEGVVPTLAAARGMSDRELVDRLVAIRGVGAWTAEMFLIFRLGRPDVLPIHDYGVRKGFAITYGKKDLPKPRELAEYGERWRPYRTVASWYLWRAVQLAERPRRQTRQKKTTIAAASHKNHQGTCPAGGLAGRFANGEEKRGQPQQKHGPFQLDRNAMQPVELSAQGI
jgi:3-methyladenine DNA glycosylase/8-oxoguanine DNA glycosylase